jgi:hypothetical protein
MSIFISPKVKEQKKFGSKFIVVNFWIMVKKNLGDFFLKIENFPKNGKQIAKVLETIKLNKKLMPII